MQFDWETQRYHQPSDDMSQPFDFNATVKCTRVDLAVGYEVAQQTERPHWNSGDFFEQIHQAVWAEPPFIRPRAALDSHAAPRATRGAAARAGRSHLHFTR